MLYLQRALLVDRLYEIYIQDLKEMSPQYILEKKIVISFSLELT